MATNTVILAPNAQYERTTANNLDKLLNITEDNYGDEIAFRMYFSRTDALSSFTYDVSPIPANATIVDVKCKFLGRYGDEENTQNITSATVTLKNKEVSGSETVYTFTDREEKTHVFSGDYNFTRDTIANAAVTVYATSSRKPGMFYFIFLFRYIELVVTYTTDALYFRQNGAWNRADVVYRKANGAWGRIAPGDVTGS